MNLEFGPVGREQRGRVRPVPLRPQREVAQKISFGGTAALMSIPESTRTRCTRPKDSCVSNARAGARRDGRIVPPDSIRAGQSSGRAAVVATSAVRVRSSGRGAREDLGRVQTNDAHRGTNFSTSRSRGRSRNNSRDGFVERARERAQRQGSLGVMLAAYNGHHDLAAHLLARGADVDTTDLGAARR